MITAIDLCNRALMRLGTQSALTSFDDGSVEGRVCQSFYDDVLNALLAHPASMGGPVHTWQWPRCVGNGKAVPCENPRWQYEIETPQDNVRILRVDHTYHKIPRYYHKRLFEPYDNYAEGMGKAGGLTLVPVVLTNHQHIRITYITRSVDIDHWPPAFRRAFWLSLAASIATTLGVDGSTSATIAQEAEREVARACMADQRVEVVNTEVPPDWIAVRFDYKDSQKIPMNHTENTLENGFIAGGTQPPSPAPASYAPPLGTNGVLPTGLQTRDIANRFDTYIPADTPDGRSGVLTIGQSPVGWRRPYHTKTLNPTAPDGTGEYDV